MAKIKRGSNVYHEAGTSLAIGGLIYRAETSIQRDLQRRSHQNVSDIMAEELYSELLKKNRQEMYGKSSEKSSLVMQDEMDLFDEANALAYEDEQEEAVNIAEHKRLKKKKYTMDNLPGDIEKEYRDYDLEDKDCPTCGGKLYQIRVDEKLELVMIPAQQKLIIHRIQVYTCRSC